MCDSCCLLFLVAQSNVPLDIQEVDKSVAIVSYTPPDVEVSQLPVLPTHDILAYVHFVVYFTVYLHMYVQYVSRRKCFQFRCVHFVSISCTTLKCNV